MNDLIKDKLAKLPQSPGVYFHKNSGGEIIYIGKAAHLNNRVRQYFQTSRLRDPKTDLLVSEITDIDWTEVASEAEALFLEAEMIRRYLPKYNILLRDDKSNAYVRIDLKATAPSVSIIRNPADDGAIYLGPFLQAGPLRKALRYLRKTFPFSTHTTLPSRACLDYHLGLCPGPETPSYDRAQYLKNLQRLMLFIHGKRPMVVCQLENEMKHAAAVQNFELAAILRNRLKNLKTLQTQVIFSDRESLDLSKDHALADLTELLSLAKPPRRIEGFDVSHIQGTDTAASMVVFNNGVADKTAYRKFKMRVPGNDDTAHIYEALNRRLQAKNIKQWGKPDLILIDGGKGQLTAAIKARDELNLKIPIFGLAKRYEELIISKKSSFVHINESVLRGLKGLQNDKSADFMIIDLPNTSHIVKLLQRIRDESHRFALNYHSVLAVKRQRASLLDDIPGVGPATKKKLLKTFGSTNAIKKARDDQIIKVIGQTKTSTLRRYLNKDEPNS